MEGIIQRTSSQNKGIDATNNNNNNNNNVKLTNSKPPILPKPQITKLDSSAQRSVKSSPSSPGPTAVENGPTPFKPKTNHHGQNESMLHISKTDRLSQKPPLISPKPQLPPKFNTANCSKLHSGSPGPHHALSQRNSSEASNSPSGSLGPHHVISPQRNSDSSLNLPSGSDNLPTRPPRTPSKTFKKPEPDCMHFQQNFLGNSDVPDNWTLSKQKSASLGRNEELNRKMQDIINNEDQLSEFCKQVEMCSRHSHLLKMDAESSLSVLSWKKRLDQFDLASTISNSCYSDSSSMSNHEQGEQANNSPPPINGSSNGLRDAHHWESTNNRNGIKKKSHAMSSTYSSSEKSRLSGDLESPKSFLHRYVSYCHQGKEENKTEKPEFKNNNVQSFLHKNRVQAKASEGSGESPPRIQQQNDTNSSDTVKDICTQDNVDKSVIADKDPVDNFKRSDHFFRALSHTDGSPFSKRFPWFGSFGKGNKKEAGKKGRCISQFYSSTMDVDAHIFKHKARTKSLPDIKHTRVVPDGSFILKNSETPTNSSVTTLSNEYAHSDSDDDKDSLNQVDVNSDKDCTSNTRAFLKAKELMTSEEVFIDVLQLLNVDFRNFVQLKNFESKNSCIPMTEVNKILNHLAQLQSLNEDILEDLRKRIKNWETNPKISDVIVKKGAFLKMYTTYIQNFEWQTNYLDECMQKYPKFGKVVKEFEASERCKKLTLKHYMLKPVQRIPQYRLLLNDYLKHLDESSVDYTDTQSALKIVCEVVDHANRNLAHGDKEGKLMHFQSILTEYALIKPGRELIKDGPLEKICRKSTKDRYFILLNDCLLHTTYSKQYMKIHQELPLSGMKVLYNDDQIFPHSFTVQSVKRSFILCAKNEKDCKDWVEKLQQAIEEYIKKQKTFLNVKIELDNTFKLGKEAPVWVPDSKVTMCQICTAEFTALFRRHHCRGCGKVVCRNCGSNQAPLQYTNFKPDRVCDQCFDVLLKDYEDMEDSVCDILKDMFNLSEENVQNEYLSLKTKFFRYSSANSLKKQKNIPQRLKEVSANDSESTISGWLYRKSRKSWKMFWYVLKDHVLYVYKASEDVLALQTIPVLGYEVERAVANYEDLDKKLIFSLLHPSQSPLVFRAESQSSADRWFEALTAASNFDHLAI